MRYYKQNLARGFFKLFILTFVLFIHLPNIYAQPTQSEFNKNENTGDFSFEVEILNDQLLICEPLIIQIKISNKSTETLRFTSSPFPGSDLTIDIRRPKRLPFEFISSSSGMTPEINQMLDPGEYRYYNYYVIFDNESDTGYLFTEPQEVVISLKLRYGNTSGIKSKSWKSSPVKFKVLKPEGSCDEIRQSFMNKKTAASFQQLICDQNNVGIFEQALQKCTHDCAYRPFILFMLGRYYSGKSATSKDVTKSTNYYNTLLEDYPDSFLADDALLMTAVNLDEVGMKEEAKRILIRLHNNYPHSDRASITDPIFKKYFDIKNSDEEPAINYLWMLFQ